jgi:transposase
MTTVARSGVGCRVLGGVDTHKDVHVAAVIDDLGRILATAEFPAMRYGYRRLVAWLRGFGELVVVGVEGGGSWGAGLARYLSAHGVPVVEVNRPNRQHRRRRGTSDTVDAEAAARRRRQSRKDVVRQRASGCWRLVRIDRQHHQRCVHSVSFRVLESAVGTYRLALLRRFRRRGLPGTRISGYPPGTR